MSDQNSIIAIVDPNSLNSNRIVAISDCLSAYHNMGFKVSIFILSNKDKYHQLACSLAENVGNSGICSTIETVTNPDKLTTFAQLGFCICNLLHEQDRKKTTVLIFSAKGSYLTLEGPIRMMGFDVVLQNLQNKTSLNPSAENSHESNLPEWYNPNYQIGKDDIGLYCTNVPDETRLQKPTFIPFDKKMRTVSVGSSADISLELWDNAKGLYPKHVEIEYQPLPDSKWFIRSLRGVRRGNKTVLINNQLISAASSNVNINAKDKITLGGFEFIFKTSRLEELIRYESPESLMVYIEKAIKTHVERYPVKSVPLSLKDDVKVQENSEGGSIWTHAYLRHYGIFLQHNWNHPLTHSFRDQYKNVMKFKKNMIELNNVRNMIMHPKEEISIKDKKFLSITYLRILDCTAHNSQ